MIKTSMRRITDFYGGSGTHDWIACAALALLLLVALGGCNDKKQGSSPPPKVNTPELNQRTTKEPPAAPTISIPVVQQRYSLVLGSWSSGLTERQLLLELSSMSESTAIVHLYSPLDTIANGFLRVVGNMVEDAFAEDERQTCNLALKTAAYRFLASESNRLSY